MDFKNKVVWITGASSGIGEALAKALASSGAKLILSARRENKLQEVKSACGLSDESGLVLPLDLEKYEEMEAKVKIAMAHFGRIDMLINNGGLSQRSLVKDTDLAVFKKLMDVDYLGTVALSKAVLPIFVEQQSGIYVAVSSLMGKFSSPFRSGYCGAKHALHGFFDSLRLEHEDDNIQVTIVCPGFIRTDVSKNALTGDGTPQQTMDEATGAGISAENCAAQILKAVSKKQHEKYIGGKETIAIYLKRWFPGILHRVLRNSNVT